MSVTISKLIRLAASRACFPGVDSGEYPSRAAALGFDGITLEQCEESPLPVAVLSSTTGFTGVKHADAEAAHRIRHLIELAGECHCSLVEVPAGAGTVSRMSIPAISDWLLPMADEAAKKGVTLAVMNGPILRTVAMMWNFIERADHPAIACSWDFEQSKRWGETPGMIVPVLGARLVVGRFATVDDTARQIIHRLRGIGFDGWLILSNSDIATGSSLATIKDWISPKKAAKPAGKKAAAAK